MFTMKFNSKNHSSRRPQMVMAQAKDRSKPVTNNGIAFLSSENIQKAVRDQLDMFKNLR